MKMMKLIIQVGICALAPLLLAQGEDERPILKESPAKLVNVIESMAEETVMAARINVAHDAAEKRVRIFSVVPGEKTGDFKKYGYDVEVICNLQIVSSKVGVASYHFQHDSEVLAFAAAQFAAGKREFGLSLVKLLAVAEPDLGWSIPTHPVMTIQQILTGLEKDHDTVKDFLKDESDDWAETVKIYGP